MNVSFVTHLSQFSAVVFMLMIGAVGYAETVSLSVGELVPITAHFIQTRITTVYSDPHGSVPDSRSPISVPIESLYPTSY